MCVVPQPRTRLRPWIGIGACTRRPPVHRWERNIHAAHSSTVPCQNADSLLDEYTSGGAHTCDRVDALLVESNANALTVGVERVRLDSEFTDDERQILRSGALDVIPQARRQRIRQRLLAAHRAAQAATVNEAEQRKVDPGGFAGDRTGRRGRTGRRTTRESRRATPSVTWRIAQRRTVMP